MRDGARREILRRTRFGNSLVVALASALLVTSSLAGAETEEQRKGRVAIARAHYDEAESAFESGDYRRAAEGFEAAYAVFPHHSSLWSAARAWRSANEEVRAANLLERYLREAPANAPDRDRATALLGELSKRLGRLEFLLAGVRELKLDGSPVDGDRLWVVPGEHVATAEWNDKPVRKVVKVAAADRLSVTFEESTAPAVVVRRSKPLPPWVVFVGGGLTLAGTGVSIWSGIDTLERRDAFLVNPTQSTLDDAHASQTRTNVAIGSTIGVAVLTGLAAFFVEWSGEAP